MQSEDSTTKAYNDNAKVFSKYFSGIGTRSEDIKKAFSYFPTVQHKNLKILELGCGDGRDAKEIAVISNNYIGIDSSVGMINLAKKALPHNRFAVKDFTKYIFPTGIDIIFAFASLLHINKKEIKVIFEKSYASLPSGGIFYISLKEGQYRRYIKTNEYGSRVFYFYSPEDIERLAGGGFEVVEVIKKSIGKTNWFDIVLRKKSINPRLLLRKTVK